jgi:myosin heavy subunit
MFQLALDTLGFTADEKLSIYKLVASCILLGQLKFAERSGLDMSFIEDIDGIYYGIFVCKLYLLILDAEKVSSLLGIKAGKLVDALSQPTIRIGEMLIRKNQTLNKVYSTFII